MKFLKKKGFSLIELLAVLVIVGVLAVLTIVSVNRYLDRSRNEKDKQNRNNAEIATELYLQDNQSLFPVMVGDSTKIDLSTLRKANYLKDNVKNSKGEDCMEKSFVRVYKLSQTEYSYYTYLYCGDDIVPAEVDVPKPVIENFKFTGGHFNGSGFDDVKDAKFSFTMKGSAFDDTIGIYSYQYVVYVDSREKGVFEEVFNSGNLMGGFEPAITVTSKELSNYLSITGFSSIKVEIHVINEQGGKDDYTSIIGDYVDKKAPLCTEIYGEAKDDNDWINKVSYANRDIIGNERKGVARISVGCDDEAGSGCKRDLFTRTWPNDDKSDSGEINYKYGTRWGYVLIEDNAKNTNATKCYVRANVDLQSPKVVVTVYSKNGDTRKKVADLTVQDDTTINARVPDGTIYAGDYQSLVGSGSEKWMNKENYKDGIEIDVKVSDNLYLYSYEWDTNDPGVAGGTSNTIIRATASLNNGNTEQGSGTAAKGNFTSVLVDDPVNDEELSLAEHGLQTGEIKGLKLVREGKRYGKLTVCDKAGNCTVVHIYANIDRTPPAVPQVSYIKKTSGDTYTPGTSNDYFDHNHWSNQTIRAYIDKQRVDTDMGQGEISGWDHFDYVYRKQTGKNNGNLIWNNPTKVRVNPGSGDTAYGFDISDQGTHIVTFDSCDKAGNCSNMSNNQYVKIDTVKPTCTIQKTYNGTSGPNSDGWLKKGESVTLSHNCSDADSKYSSGCNDTHRDNQYTTTYSTNIQTTKAGVAGENKGGYVWDYAGNQSNECPKDEKIKIDIDPPTCSTKANVGSSSGTTYSGGWTTSNIMITGVCNDTGGSTCKANPTTLYDSDIDSTVSFTKNVEDKAGNKTACNGSHLVQIDKTKPTGSCTIVGSYSTDSSQSYTIRVDSSSDPVINGAASGVKSIKYKKTGDTSFGSANTMNLVCTSSGTKEGWIQITDEVGNVSAAIKCSSSITVPTCCSKVDYENGSTCTVKCGGGTYNQLAYSHYNGSRCSAKDLSSGGSRCNTAECCGSNAVFSSSTNCTKSCGGGTTTYYYVSKYDSSISCGSKQYSCNTQSCGPVGNVCSVRGSRKRSVATWYGCTGGDGPHNQAYYHYCWDGSKYVTKGENPTLNTYWYVCPNKPYGTGQGWTIIND